MTKFSYILSSISAFFITFYIFSIIFPFVPEFCNIPFLNSLFSNTLLFKTFLIIGLIFFLIGFVDCICNQSNTNK